MPYFFFLLQPEVQQRKEKKAQPKGKDDSFMGLKKGFLLGGFGDDKPKAKRKENNIPTIKPKLDKKEDSFKIKEVQDALQRASPLLQNKGEMFTNCIILHCFLFSFSWSSDLL